MKKILILMSFILFLVGCEQMPTKTTKHRAEKVSRMDVKWVDAYAKEVGVDNKYYYKQLSDKEKRAYLAIYSAAQEYYEDLTVVDLTEESMERVKQSLFLDNLDVWSMRFISTGRYSDDKYTIGQLFSGENKETIQSQVEQVNTFLNDVVKNIPEGSTYDKVKYVYEYVTNYLEYDYSNSQLYNKTIIDAIKDKKAVQTGYVKLFCAILERAGIEAIVVSGQFVDEENSKKWLPSIWAAVNVDGDYYYVDPAWGDFVEGLDYSYLLMDKIFFDKNYKLVVMKELSSGFEELKFPEPSTKSMNYYALNGAYFEEYNPEEVAKFAYEKFKNNDKIDFQVSYRYTDEEVDKYFSDIAELLAYKYGLYGMWHGTTFKRTNVIKMWRE